MNEHPNDRDCGGCGQCETCVELSAAHYESSALADMERAKDDAYAERNRMVAALAHLAHNWLVGWSVGVKRTEIEGWDPEWQNCVFFDTPEGQLSWHFHDREAPLFAGLPPYDGTWDGHTTPEKYDRLARAVTPWPNGNPFGGPAPHPASLSDED